MDSGLQKSRFVVTSIFLCKPEPENRCRRWAIHRNCRIKPGRANGQPAGQLSWWNQPRPEKLFTNIWHCPSPWSRSRARSWNKDILHLSSKSHHNSKWSPLLHFSCLVCYAPATQCPSVHELSPALTTSYPIPQPSETNARSRALTSNCLILHPLKTSALSQASTSRYTTPQLSVIGDRSPSAVGRLQYHAWPLPCQPLCTSACSTGNLGGICV